MRYSVDTSAILDGWRRYYPIDTFPGLWTRISELVVQNHLRATEEVLFELRKQDGEVLAWVTQQQNLFVTMDKEIQLKVREILLAHPDLVDAGKGRSGADPFVIALAELNNCTVISGEQLTGRLNRPRIPDICSARSIPHGNLLFLIQQEGWKF